MAAKLSRSEYNLPLAMVDMPTGISKMRLHCRQGAGRPRMPASRSEPLRPRKMEAMRAGDQLARQSHAHSSRTVERLCKPRQTSLLTEHEAPLDTGDHKPQSQSFQMALWNPSVSSRAGVAHLLAIDEHTSQNSRDQYRRRHCATCRRHATALLKATVLPRLL